MTTRYMNDYEKEMLAFMQELNELKTIVHNAEKRIDYAKDRINELQEKFFELEEKYGKA